MKKFLKMNWFTFGTYILLILATLLVGYIMLHNNKTLNNVITSFFEVAENRSFDYRQSLKILHKSPIPNKDIVVLAIDDASLEKLWDKYGEWPMPRNIYADIINYIEKDKPSAIVFDLLFIKSMKNESIADKILVEAMNKYNNIYTGMNFDYQPEDLRTPADLPKRLSLNINNNSQIDLKKKHSYTNCRTILSELINGNVKVGITNVIRSNDGIIRKIAPLMYYKENYYPYLAFKASSDYISNKNVQDLSIDKKGNLLVSNTTIPLTNDGEAILNWYGKSGTHTIYPLYKIINQLENKNLNTKFNFKNKIVVIGTTAMSLHDTKSVPVQEGVYPGVEVHATFINNMIDNNFIKQTNLTTNSIIIIFTISLVGLIVMFNSILIYFILCYGLV